MLVYPRLMTLLSACQETLLLSRSLCVCLVARGLVMSSMCGHHPGEILACLIARVLLGTLLVLLLSRSVAQGFLFFGVSLPNRRCGAFWTAKTVRIHCDVVFL